MKPVVIHLDNGSLLVEWIDKQYRFGISIEQDPSESSWFFVAKEGIAECGSLPMELLNALHSPGTDAKAPSSEPPIWPATIYP